MKGYCILKCGNFIFQTTHKQAVCYNTTCVDSLRVCVIFVMRAKLTVTKNFKARLLAKLFFRQQKDKNENYIKISDVE